MMQYILLLTLTISCSALRLQVKMTSSQPRSMRNSLQTNVKQTLSFVALFSSLAAPARAKVFFDTDTYGDKELKIATVNKLKQKLRNAILADPEVAPQLLQLAFNDALGFNAITQSGGPDGSILYELKAEGPNAGLDKGLAVLLAIKKELQRTNTVSFGDICSYGGAEALESAGCPRMTVQVGRFDAKVANESPAVVNWSAPSVAAISEAFVTSGLDARETAVLLGALGELQRVVDETITNKAKKSVDEDEDEDDDQPFVPTTFGSRDERYGARLGKGDFGTKFLSAVLKGQQKGALANALTEDPKIKAFVQKYATNEAAFLKDVSDVYLKLTNLGSELCSSKFCSS